MTTEQLDIGCDFGNVSIGDATARIGITIERDRLHLDKADEYFSGARLEGFITLGKSADLPGQKQLIPDAHQRIETVFDSKRFSVGPKDFSTGFTFSLAEIDVKDLAGFAKRSGRLCVKRISSIEDEHSDGSAGTRDESGYHPDVLDGQNRPVGTPALVLAAQEHKRRQKDKGFSFGLEILIRKQLKQLADEHQCDYNGEGITENKAESITEALEVKTVAALEKVIASDPQWHRKIKGIGQKVIDELSDAVVLFRRIHPVPSDEPEDVENPAEKPAEETAGDAQSQVQALEAKQAVVKEPGASAVEAAESGPETSPQQSLREAYQAGCEAALANKNRNPYPAGTDLANHWVDGWTDTKNQSEGVRPDDAADDDLSNDQEEPDQEEPEA